jgi:hypothetical protein
MSNVCTADVTVGKPITFYDIHGRKRKVLLFYFVPDTTRDISNKSLYNVILSVVLLGAENTASIDGPMK